MLVIPLSEAAGQVDLAGGKAAGLGEVLRLGERVPPGFCVTTEAHRLGVPPRAEILAAYRRLGAGPVAVRSSATAEDRPAASFAGQHDTTLGVHGAEDLIAAIVTGWASLHGARAVAYRTARGIDHPPGRMAVVVQRMVDAEVAGVLFTANPLTGRRTEMVVDAAPGLGPAVVDGTTAADHYVLDGSHGDDSGCLTRARLAELRAVGERLQRHFGAPQDVEWAFDRAGTLWLLQSRPITTLFPLPPPADGPQPRIYLEFGHGQGMLRPVTPMGMSTLRQVVEAMAATLGLRVKIVDIGGRLYGDLSDLARSRSARKRLVKLMAVDFGPRAQAVMRHVLADPRFAPGTGRKTGRTTNQIPALRTAGRALAGITRALARPDAARARLFHAVEELRVASAAPQDLRTTGDRLRFVQAVGAVDGAVDSSGAAADSSGAITWPIVAGLLAAALPASLLAGIAEPGEIHTILGGVPHNVTIEMDLALWRIAAGAGEHRALLLDTPPAELAERSRRGELPEIGLADFLARYGHRGAAEADLGVPRWAEDPTPVFAAIANYLRVTDPDQAPDRRFARAAATAEATLDQLAERVRRPRGSGRLAVFGLAERVGRRRGSGRLAVFGLAERVRRRRGSGGLAVFGLAERVRRPRGSGRLADFQLAARGRRRPVRGRLAVFLLRRARLLAGLREAGKFAGLYRLRAVREQLLLIGADLAAAGRLAEPDDIMFLTLDEAAEAVHRNADQRETVARRRAVHRAESRRRSVPVALLSDGTEIETILPAAAGDDGVLRGVGASAGRATGPARVVHDPATAHVEPGDILVVATTDPGWTPLFLTAAALVTETGAITAHGPTVAREYGIPAVISVPAATERIATGQLITVDGAAGTVTTAPGLAAPVDAGLGAPTAPGLADAGLADAGLADRADPDAVTAGTTPADPGTAGLGTAGPVGDDPAARPRSAAADAGAS